MLKPLPLFVLCLAAAPLSAAEPARVQAAATLTGDLGTEAVAALERRGLVLTGGGKTPRLLDVAWEPLERAVASAGRLSEFLAAFDAARKGDDPADPGDPFTDLAGLPAGGLVTEPVRAALAALADRAAAAGSEDAAAAAKTAKERLRRAEAGSEGRRAFDDLRAAAPKLAASPDLVARLKDILASADEPPAVKLTAPELHARSEDGAGFEPGDKALFSIAYWVDGLAPKAQTEVAAALYLDQGPQGFLLVRRESARRAAGGPYVFNAETVVPAAGRLTYRLVLDSPDAAPLSREASLPVSDALDGLRAEAARAEALARACRLSRSTEAWAEVLASVESRSTDARRRLASEARARLKAAEAWAAEHAELGDSLDGARLFATPERCEYRTDRAERALKILAGLPAGCDRGGAESVAAELSGLARVTDSRRRLQEGFRAALKKARDAESACRPADAAALYASALALLDTDPGARCGAYEAEYQAVRLDDLPRVVGAEGLAAAVAAELGKARKRSVSGDASGALTRLNALSTALRRLPGVSCHSALLKEADELATGAGVALGPLEASALRLGPEQAAEAVAAARKDLERRRAEAEEARGQAESLQSPAAAGEAP